MAEIGGAAIRKLAETYGTPLYAYDEDVIRNRLSDYMKYFRSDEFETGVLYASKAFSCKEMIRLIDSYGLYLDVVSGGELYTAVQAGYDCSKIFFHGNNKTFTELREALEYGVGTIVVDNRMEAEVLAGMAQEMKKDVHVLLRINPGIEAHTHQYIVTAHVDSKFGISPLSEKEMAETVQILSDCPYIHFDGIHAHIGSQIFDKRAFEEEARKMFEFAGKLKTDFGVCVNTVNLGGGFAAYYTAEDHPIPLQEVCESILAVCSEENRKLDGQIRRVLIEPGRSIVAEAGYTLYTAGFIKQTPNRLYVFADGGMSDNIRPALYQAKYDMFVDGKENDPVYAKYTLAGKCCESGDILIGEIGLPKIMPGDILVMKTTGAYGYSMASHYNKLPCPAVVFAGGGSAREVIRRETYEDLTSREV